MGRLLAVLWHLGVSVRWLRVSVGQPGVSVGRLRVSVGWPSQRPPWLRLAHASLAVALAT